MKFFKEFKEFITRGNVMDLAVGVIIGSAFTAIVTALTDNILQPIINWIIYLCLGDTADTAYTVLVRVEDATGALDLTNSIYIDWGAFISAIINFLLVALVLFLIVKAFNSVHKKGEKLKEELKKKEEEEKKEETPAAAEAAPVVEEAPKATTEDLLKEIRDLLAAQNGTANSEAADTEEK